MKKFNCISTAVVVGVLLFSSNSLFAQCPGDTVGFCDTLFVTGCLRGQCAPGTEIIITISGYHDEDLAGISIPLRFKTNQMNVTLDSVRFHPDVSAANIKDSIKDTVGDGSIGKVTILLIWFGAPLSAGVDTFATLYFTTGASWDPSIASPIDTFRLPSGQGLSFTDDRAVDIVPIYGNGCCIDPLGDNALNGSPYPCICLGVKDDNRFPSTLRPTNFSLAQNFPNPFNTETVITFALPRSGDVKIEIFSILGQKVRDLVNERVSAGYKKVVWDGRDNAGKTVASGVYFYRIRTDNFLDVKKMTLLK